MSEGDQALEAVRAVLREWQADQLADSLKHGGVHPAVFKREKKDVYLLDEVYGVRRDLPLNDVSRTNVDDVFVNSLATDKHIVVFGSSKQGKTSLRSAHRIIESPATIDGTTVVQVADLASARPTRRTRHIRFGEELSAGAFRYLVVAQYEGESDVYLFYLDEQWRVLSDTLHADVERAIQQAEYEFENVRFEPRRAGA
jgi:hypothetical protein